MTKAEALRVLTDMRRLTVWDDEEKGLEVQIEALDVAIKALEDESDLQLTCNNLATNLQVETSTEKVDTPTKAVDTSTDLISRADAIEEIARRDTTDGTVKVFSGREVNDILHNIPSAPRWIPCSERLPKDERTVLATEMSGEYFSVTMCKYIPNTGKWLPLFQGNHDNIVAWLPLPEPYKGVTE